jgi:N-acetylglutamate synthase-like GNAT family acetyltransferase
MKHAIVEPSSAEEFERYYMFRWEQLRAPWDQPRGSERDDMDDHARHVMAIDDDGRIVGVGRLHVVKPGEGKVRYMAVAPDRRGQGIGSAVFERLEAIAVETGIERIILDARESASGFYTAHGFHILEQGHTLFGSIPHVRMLKSLTV